MTDRYDASNPQYPNHVWDKVERHWMPKDALGARNSSGNGHDAPAQKSFEPIPFDEITFDTAPAYLVKGIVPRVGLCVFWGPPKCGKSFFVYDMLMHVALGWEYRGRRVRQGAVVYCAFEGQAGLRNRVEAFRQTKLSVGARGVPFYLIADAMNLVADHPALVASVRAALGDTKPAAIALDTLNRSLAGSESDDRDMAAYVKACDALRAAFDCVVSLVHHCGHEGTRPRGHSSLMGAIDAQIAVKRDAADNIIATVELMKDGPQGEEFSSRLEVVELGMDDDGDKITSCVIEPAEAPASNARGRKLPVSAENALSALRYALDEVGATPPASNHIPSGQKCVSGDQWREYAYSRSGLDNPDSKQKAFVRGCEHLTARKIVAIWKGYAWEI